MSTPVQTSLAGLKASTLKLVGIIAGARLIPAGTGEAHNVLTKQATTLLGEIVREHEKGDYIPGIVASCSKELLRVRPMTPRVWPNWHSIGHDDPLGIRAWEALGDHSCDLSVVPDPSTGPLTTSEFRDKGKGKAVAVDLAPEVEGSRKRKSPMISGHSSQPPKSAMKSRKRAKSTRPVKSAPDVESEDEEDTILQPISRGVPEVVLPQLSTIVVRTPQVPRSPGSPKKQNFGPASKTAGSRPEVSKSPISRPEATVSASDGEPPAIPPFDITVPGPVSTALNSLSSNNPCYYCVKEDWHCETRVDRRTGHPCLSCLRCATKKIKCHPVSVGSPPKRVRGKATTQRTRSKTPAPAPSTGPSASQSRTQDSKSISWGIPNSGRPCCNYTQGAVSWSQQDHWQEDPCPCPCPCHSCAAVPRAALDVPMPDLHSMAIAIRDGAARIAILEALLRRQVVDRHPSFPLPDSPANATMLLDQSVPPPSMSPLPSALPNLINLDMGVMEPTPLKVEDASDMVGLVFEPSQVQPEGPQSSGEIVVPDDPGNLFPEYTSVSEEMDVEVKAGTSGEEVEMAA
ncbi:hypothetical protein EDD22DRAFT_924105 [Suillus occidentalis]|nr:hypothetical protein EDD22DRAFT_924105 [Suillus occidentalis]